MYSPDNNIEVKLEQESSSVIVQPDASENFIASLCMQLVEYHDPLALLMHGFRHDVCSREPLGGPERC